MRVLLLQNLFYAPSHGGASKSNRILLEELAARGHECRAVAPLSGELGRRSVGEFIVYLTSHGMPPRSVMHESVIFESGGVEVHVVVEPSHLVRYATQLARQAEPEWVLVPSDDPGLLMLGAASRAAPGRVIYLAHTLQQLPFGPRSFYPSTAGTRLVRRAAGVVTVSRAAQDYVRRWSGIDAMLIYPPVYGSGPFPRCGHPDTGAVAIVNPCVYKGISIFVGLADASPEVPFLAVAGWGTDRRDRIALARRPNIHVIEAVDDIDLIYARTRILLMPSLWDETFGYSAVEAMLRGIPVLAADVGGMGEAKLGVPYLLPVRPIERYERHSHEPRPKPIGLGHQDLTPWITTMRRLLTDPAHYRQVADRSRSAALAFVGALDPAALAVYLSDLTPATTQSPRRDRAARLSPDRRAALARLLAARQAPAPAGDRSMSEEA